MQAVALAVKLGRCVDTVCVDTSQITKTLTVAPKVEAQLPYVRIVASLFYSGKEKILRSFIFYSVDVFIYLGEIENTSKVCTNQEKIKSVLNPSMKASTSTVSCSLLCQ